MANNKMYANFLMHGRTKGSKNGISNTKGYTAVGKKAKGKLINGRYVYDYYTPYGTKPSTLMEGYTPLAAISTREQERQEQREKDDYKARLNKSMAETAARVKAENAAKAKTAGYKQMASQSSSQEWRDKQERAKAEKAKADAAKNNWQYEANKTYGINTMINKAATGESKSVNGSEFYDKYINEATYNRAIKKVDGDKGIAWAYNGPDANMDSAYNRLKAAREKTISKGEANNWQQQAAYQQQKESARNRALASAAKGAANNWQAKANAARAMTEYGRKAETARKAKYAKEKVKSVLERDSLSGKTHGHMNVDPSKSLVSNQWQRYGEEARTRKQYGDSSVGHKTFAEEQADTTKKHISQEKMKAKQPNAMLGDTRYTVKENAMKGDPRYSKDSADRMLFEEARFLGRPITGSGNNGEAVTTKDFYTGKKGKAPYSNQLDKASNKQEYTAATAKQKAFDNAYKESRVRNSRSDIGNAVADFKEEAKAKAKSLFKKKKKK